MFAEAEAEAAVAVHMTTHTDSRAMRYLLVAAIVLGVNLLPAFGPPTWSVLVGC